MNSLTPNNQRSSEWKTRAYVVGIAAGTLFGLLSAYLYTRAAEDDAAKHGKPARIATGEVVGLGLTLLGVVRQITEMGKHGE